MTGSPLDGHRSTVVGAGSIGSRHRRVLEDLGSTVSMVSRRPEVGTHATIAEAVDATEPDYVVLATETERHLESIERLVDTGFRGRALLEKPAFDDVRPFPDLPFASVAVGYQLRFHPAVQRLRDEIAGSRVLSAQVRYGQHLPDWRPGRDYRSTVTAGPGGGVLLELSHEIDLVHWLLGAGTAVFGRTRRSGLLDIEREDLAVGVIELDTGGLVGLELNALDRRRNRTMTVTTADHFFHLDLVAGRLERDDEVLVPGPVERDELFADLHLATIAGAPGPCTPDEALEVLRTIRGLRST